VEGKDEGGRRTGGGKLRDITHVQVRQRLRECHVRDIHAHAALRGGVAARLVGTRHARLAQTLARVCEQAMHHRHQRVAGRVRLCVRQAQRCGGVLQADVQARLRGELWGLRERTPET